MFRSIFNKYTCRSFIKYYELKIALDMLYSGTRAREIN